jgi:hypothetical protein
MPLNPAKARDLDLGARRDLAPWKLRRLSRQADEAIGVHPALEVGDLGVRTSRRGVAEPHQVVHAERRLNGAPAVGDFYEYVAPEERLDSALGLGFRGEDFEAGVLAALGGEALALGKRFCDGPIWHGRRIQRPARFRSRPNLEHRQRGYPARHLNAGQTAILQARAYPVKYERAESLKILTNPQKVCPVQRTAD